MCRGSVKLASQIGKACVEDRYCLCRGSVFTRVSSLQCALTLVPAAKLCICRIFSASWIYCRHSPGTRGRRCKQVLLCGRSVFFCVRHRYSCFSLHSPHGDFAFRGPHLCGRSVSLPPHHQVSEEAARPCTRAASGAPPRPSFSPPNSRVLPPPGHLIRMILGGSVKLAVELMSYEKGVVETLDSLR